MKNLNVILVLVLAFASSFAVRELVKDSLKVKVAESEVHWYATKVTGKHDGTVAIKSGTLEVEKGKLVGGQFEIDMTTIKVTDIPADKGGAKLEGHLKNADFFDVTKFTTAQLKIKKATKSGDKALLTGADKYQVKADLTIKGITQETDFEAFVTIKGKTADANASITFDRSKFDIRYGSETFFGSLGDKAIYNDVKLDIKLKASK